MTGSAFHPGRFETALRTVFAHESFFSAETNDDPSHAKEASQGGDGAEPTDVGR